MVNQNRPEVVRWSVFSNQGDKHKREARAGNNPYRQKKPCNKPFFKGRFSLCGYEGDWS